MRYALEALKKGDTRLPRAFEETDRRLTAVFWDVDTVDVRELARRLTVVQDEIEGIFGNRDLGKDCMPWSALAHFYSSQRGYKRGMESAARKVVQAFTMSECSLEVKTGAEAAAVFYGLADKEAE
jgi:hypothetical protein